MLFFFLSWFMIVCVFKKSLLWNGKAEVDGMRKVIRMDVYSSLTFSPCASDDDKEQRGEKKERKAKKSYFEALKWRVRRMTSVASWERLKTRI